MALRFLGKDDVQPPSATVVSAGNAIHVKHDGALMDSVTAAQMHLNQWDERRCRALERRLRSNWVFFNDLFAELPELATEERVRIKLRMDRIEEELCVDFRNMGKIYERMLGISLPDHYTLYEVCGR